MRVADLSSAQLADTLRHQGLSFRIGRFVIHLQTPVLALARTFALLYGQYPLAAPGTFTDFRIRLAPPSHLRRWLRPQIQFLLDEQAPFKPLPLNHGFPLFEWGLNWCCANYLNQFLILHAAVLERTGWGLVLPGAPGSGKSTLCGALLHRGWRLLSDELALVSLQNTTLTPLPRPVSLKNESIEVLRAWAPTAVMGPPAVDTQKGVVVHLQAPASAVARSEETALPAWLVFPRYQPSAELQLQSYPKARAFLRAAENSFNYARLGTSAFRALTHLIDVSDCYELTYGNLALAVDTLSRLSRSAVKDSSA